MKILMYNDYYYPNIIGGAEVSAQSLAEGLAMNGHDVIMLTSSLVGKKIEKINNVTIYRMSTSKFLESFRLLSLRLFGEKIHDIIMYIIGVFNISKVGIKKIISDLQPDIIHIHNLYKMSPNIWKVMGRTGIPIVHTAHDISYACRLTNCAKRCSLNSDINVVCIGKPNKYCNITNKVIANNSHYVDYLVGPSNFDIEIYSNGGYFDKAKKQTVYCGIDFNEKDVKNIYEEKKSRLKCNYPIKFLFMGSLVGYKGIIILLQTFIKLDNDEVELHIAGNGPLLDVVQGFVEKDKRIHYHGFVFGKVKEHLLQSCDVLVFPSACFETFGMVIGDFRCLQKRLACNS